MKAKMGKRRFAMLMQTMGPMMSRMMENGGGGLGGMMGGGGMGGGLAGGNFGGGYGAPNYGGYAPMGGGTMPMGIGGMGGGDIMGMLGGAGGGDMMAMIPQLMRLANVGSGGHRRHKHR
jgi:hypothetical protein